MELEPIGDRIFLQLPEQKKQTEGGIIIPETSKSKEKPAQGVVVAVGRADSLREADIQPGQIVYFTRFAGAELKHDNNTYFVVRLGDIVAVQR